jgi:hypothetical protein
MKFTSALVVAAATLLASTAASATSVVTFATYSSTASGTNFRWVRSAATTAGNNAKNVSFYTTSRANGTVAGATNVVFFYKDLGAFSSTFNSGIPAKLLLEGTVTNTPATRSGTQITQTSLTGTFSFTANNMISFGSASGRNLLSGSFSQVTFSGTNGGSTGGINGSTTGGSSISYSSDFLTFSGGSSYDIGFSLTSILPLLSQTNNRALASFRGVLTGNFSSNPAPVPPSIPEPGTWAMMIAGIGLVGFARRRRRIVLAA